MTEWEIQDWLLGLGHNDHIRAKVIRELLAHKEEDRMSRADIRICETGLRTLEERIKRKAARARMYKLACKQSA